MLSESDYDYEYIANHYIKFTHQALCLSFELNNEKKKCFYKFEKKKGDNESESPPKTNESETTFNSKARIYRKTVFALENEQHELKIQSNLKAKTNTQYVESDNNDYNFNDMSK
jgi:hypothetical protein